MVTMKMTMRRMTIMIRRKNNEIRVVAFFFDDYDDNDNDNDNDNSRMMRGWALPTPSSIGGGVSSTSTLLSTQA